MHEMFSMQNPKTCQTHWVAIPGLGLGLGRTRTKIPKQRLGLADLVKHAKSSAMEQSLHVARVLHISGNVSMIQQDQSQGIYVQSLELRL